MDDSPKHNSQKPEVFNQTDEVNKKILVALLDRHENESDNQKKCIEALIIGENSPIIKNFNPKNHLEFIHKNGHE